MFIFILSFIFVFIFIAIVIVIVTIIVTIFVIIVAIIIVVLIVIIIAIVIAYVIVINRGMSWLIPFGPLPCWATSGLDTGPSATKSDFSERTGLMPKRPSKLARVRRRGLEEPRSDPRTYDPDELAAVPHACTAVSLKCRPGEAEPELKR
eukprot:s196_g12.t1